VTEPAALRIAKFLQIAIELIHSGQPAGNRPGVPKTTGKLT